MYNNIGGKLKALAGVACALGILGSVAWALSFSNVVVCILIVGLGTLISWISTMALYGYGEMVEKTCQIQQEVDGLKNEISSMKFYLKTMCDIMNKQDHERQQ